MAFIFVLKIFLKKFKKINIYLSFAKYLKHKSLLISYLELDFYFLKKTENFKKSFCCSDFTEDIADKMSSTLLMNCFSTINQSNQ